MRSGSFVTTARLPDADDDDAAARRRRPDAGARGGVRARARQRRAGVPPRHRRLRRRVVGRVHRASGRGRGGAATAPTRRRCCATPKPTTRACVTASEAFDAELMGDLRAARRRGVRAARGAGLPPGAGRAQARRRRQTASRCYFSKENFTNGCIATVDVIYPSSPLFLLFSPDAAGGAARADPRLRRVAALEVPLRAARPRHLPAGQRPGLRRRRADRGEPDAGRGVRQHAADPRRALAKIDGNADFASKYWPHADASGRSTSRTRASTRRTSSAPTTSPATSRTTRTCRSRRSWRSRPYADALPSMRGDAAEAARLRDAGRRTWPRSGTRTADDGDHYRLAFDQPGTWSQKYNLVWDSCSASSLFPPDVARRRSRTTRRSRTRTACRSTTAQTYTKLDWIVWTATLADDAQDFEALIDPLYAFLNETPDRVPMTDWYWTDRRQSSAASRPARSSAACSSRCSSNRDLIRQWSSRPGL